MNAPLIDTNVPINFNRLLCALRFNISILEMMATMKVKAGERLFMAEARVGELYRIPMNKKIEQQQQRTPRRQRRKMIERLIGGGGVFL